MKYVCLFLLGATCFCGKLAAGPNPGTLSLWYDRPAARWEEALPLGNGRLGVMVYGGCGREELQLNEETIRVGDRLAMLYDGATGENYGHMGRGINLAWLALPLVPPAK